MRGFGGSADAAGGTGEVVVHLQYDTATDAAERGAPAVRDLRDALREEVEALTVPDVSIETDDATVVVTIDGDPTAFYEELRENAEERRGPRAPQVAFEFEKREDGRVAVTHEGGDEVGTRGRLRLIYESDGETVERGWEPDDGSITAGDTVTTDGAVTGPLRVVWEADDSGTSAVLGAYRPDDDPPQEPPEVVFDFERRAEGRVTIVHDGGENIDRALVVRYDGGEAEKWGEEDGTISAGDSYTTRGALAEDGSLQIVWPGDEEPVVVGQFTTAPTATPARERTPTPKEDTPTRTPRDRRTATADRTPTRTPEETPTRTPTPEASDTPTRTPTRTEAAAPGTETGTATETGTSTATETSSATATETSAPTSSPTGGS
jgi:hypothetical protein